MGEIYVFDADPYNVPQGEWLPTGERFPLDSNGILGNLDPDQSPTNTVEPRMGCLRRGKVEDHKNRDGPDWSTC